MAKTTNKTWYARYKSYAQGAIYHVYNRGIDKQDIFRDNADFTFYLNRLNKYLEKHSISLLSYCLMPNHIHLAVKQETKNPVNKFISSLHTSYGMYFNKKYDRAGHLFQDRFKQIILETDEQLLYLTKYIHLNPVAAGLVEKPEDYVWSSYHEYVGSPPTPICKKEVVMDLLTPQRSGFIQKYKEFCQKSNPDSIIESLEEIALEAF